MDLISHTCKVLACVYKCTGSSEEQNPEEHLSTSAQANTDMFQVKTDKSVNSYKEFHFSSTEDEFKPQEHHSEMKWVTHDQCPAYNNEGETCQCEEYITQCVAHKNDGEQCKEDSTRDLTTKGSCPTSEGDVPVTIRHCLYVVQNFLKHQVPMTINTDVHWTNFQMC